MSPPRIKIEIFDNNSKNLASLLMNIKIEVLSKLLVKC
jgi:hypothetical protein